MSTRAVSRPGKKDKSEVIDDLKGELEVVLLRCQNSGVPVIEQGMRALQDAVRDMSDQTATQFMAALSLANLKEIAEKTTNGNGDHKMNVLNKAFNTAAIATVANISKVCSAADSAIALYNKIVLLSAFGNEDGSISWAKLQGELVRVVGVKSAAAGGRGLGA